jgi:Rho termination factor, N-terminal domain
MDMSGNDTPNTPELSETELRGTKVDELRERARDEGISGASSMRKAELVEAISEQHREGGEAGDAAGTAGDAGPDGGHVRRGPETSKSLQYSQEITSPEDDPERPGRSLVTTSHEVIRAWAEARDAVPATVEGTEHEDHLGVLRFQFGDQRSERLRTVSWEEWFDTFDARSLNFIYQEERKDGKMSNFFQFESPYREDA